jgi:hypothetical protein
MRNKKGKDMTIARRKLPAGILATGFPSKRDEAVLNAGGIRCESVLLDFATDGGAVGTINCQRQLPAGAIVVRILSDELTALTSGGAATVQLQCGAVDLTDALAFDTDFTGLDTQALASSAQAIKVSTAADLKIDIAAAALTAGKVRFLVEYILPND